MNKVKYVNPEIPEEELKTIIKNHANIEVTVSSSMHEIDKFSRYNFTIVNIAEDKAVLQYKGKSPDIFPRYCIRGYTRDQYEQSSEKIIRELKNADLPDYLGGYIPEYFEPDSHPMFLILYDNDVAVGYLKYYLPEDDPDDYYEVDKLGVCANHRGKGLGKFLLNYIINVAKFQGKNVKLSSIESASEFYKKIGFIDMDINGKSCYMIYIINPVISGVKLLSVDDAADKCEDIYWDCSPTKILMDVRSSSICLSKSEKNMVKYAFMYCSDLIIGTAKILRCENEVEIISWDFHRDFDSDELKLKFMSGILGSFAVSAEINAIIPLDSAGLFNTIGMISTGSFQDKKSGEIFMKMKYINVVCN